MVEANTILQCSYLPSIGNMIPKYLENQVMLKFFLNRNFTQNWKDILHLKQAVKTKRKTKNHETFSSLQLSCSVVSDSAMSWIAAHQASLSITKVRSLPNSCPLSRWCHPTISYSVVPFSYCLQSFLASGSFAMSKLFA